jgi:hypothetical protein
MSKIACLLLAGFFLLGLSCQLSGTSRLGYIVFSAVDNDGRPLPELVVLDASGNRLRRIDLPADKKYSNLYYSAYPFHHPSQRAFTYAPGGVNYLIDVTSGEVKPILEPNASSIQTNANPMYLCSPSGNAGLHWALLCRGNIPYLVNLETAEVYDILPEPPGDQMSPFKSWLSPDETYFAIRTDSGTFILPAANPESIRRLGGNAEIPEVGFSTDGKRIVYVRATASKGYEVIVENVDGSQPGVMHTSEYPMQAAFVPHQEQILVRETGKMLLLSLSSRSQQEFTPLEGLPLDTIFSPQGQQVLVSYSYSNAGTIRWQWLDLQRNIAKEIQELEGYRANHSGFEQRWVTLNDLSPGSGQAKMHVTSIDLQTGSVQTLATLENISQYWENSISADGKFKTAVAAPTEGQMQLWVLDLDGGKASLLVEDTAVQGDISPDGKQVIIFYRHRNGDQFESKIELRDTSGKLLKSLGNGFSPFWVWP